MDASTSSAHENANIIGSPLDTYNKKNMRIEF